MTIPCECAHVPWLCHPDPSPTLCKGLQRQSRLPGLDGQQPLTLQRQEVLLLQLLHLQELLLKGQLLRGHLLLLGLEKTKKKKKSTLVNTRAKQRIYRAPCLNLLQLLTAVTGYQGQASEPTTPGKDPEVCLGAGANTGLQIPISSG